MANKTITQLDTITPASADEIPIWDISEGTTEKATIADIVNSGADSFFCQNPTIVKNASQSSTTTEAVSFTDSYTIPETGGYILSLNINNIKGLVATNSLAIKINDVAICSIENTSSAGWTVNQDSIFILLKKDTTLNFVGSFDNEGFRYSYKVIKVF